MKQSAKKAINMVIGIEGGYSDNIYDPGGKTKYGITEYVARQHGYKGDMRHLPVAKAYSIYKKAYWDKLSLDDVVERSEPLAAELFEYGVNCGVGRAGEALQRCLNAFNNKGKYYGDLYLDGAVGPNTLNALYSYLDMRGEEGEAVLLKSINGIQANYYIELAEKSEKFETFAYGWINHRISLDY